MLGEHAGWRLCLVEGPAAERAGWRLAPLRLAPPRMRLLADPGWGDPATCLLAAPHTCGRHDRQRRPARMRGIAAPRHRRTWHCLPMCLPASRPHQAQGVSANDALHDCLMDNIGLNAQLYNATQQVQHPPQDPQKGRRLALGGAQQRETAAGGWRRGPVPGGRHDVGGCDVVRSSREGVPAWQAAVSTSACSPAFRPPCPPAPHHTTPARSWRPPASPRQCARAISTTQRPRSSSAGRSAPARPPRVYELSLIHISEPTRQP